MTKVPVTDNQVLQPFNTTTGAAHTVSLSSWMGKGLLHANGGSFDSCDIKTARDGSTCTGSNAICYFDSLPASKDVVWTAPANPGTYTLSGAYAAGYSAAVKVYSVTVEVMAGPPSISTPSPTSTTSIASPTSTSSASLLSFHSSIAFIVAVLFNLF